jgi:hypothetical protein
MINFGYCQVQLTTILFALYCHAPENQGSSDVYHRSERPLVSREAKQESILLQTNEEQVIVRGSRLSIISPVRKIIHTEVSAVSRHL